MNEALLNDPRTVFSVEIRLPKHGVDLKQKGLTYKEAKEVFEKARQRCLNDDEAQEHFDSVRQGFGFCSVSWHDGTGSADIGVSCEKTNAEAPEIKQTCPERLQGFGPWERKENLDKWEMRGDDRCCSFCGSLHPERVLELLQQHGPGIIDPSTKSYKFYVRQPDVPNAGFGGIKYYRWHDKDAENFVDRYNQLIDQFNVGEAQ